MRADPFGPPLVTKEYSERPVAVASGHAGVCLYCRQPEGRPHRVRCVAWTRPVILRATFKLDPPLVLEVTETVPMSWDVQQIVSARNEGTWCSGNLYDQHEHVRAALRAALDPIIGPPGDDVDVCFCGSVNIEYVGEA